MDIGTLQGIWTIVALVIFIGIVAWAWSSRRKSEFDAAARMPLDDDEPMERSGSKETHRG